MEIMKSHLPETLDMNNSKPRPYIKPPIPPKPKNIPKPKPSIDSNNLNAKPNKIKKCFKENLRESLTNSYNLTSVSVQKEVSYQGVQTSPEIKEDQSTKLHNQLPVIRVSQCLKSNSRAALDRFTRVVSFESCDDTSSRLMERALENCVESSSKSSSDSSSLSLGDSDNDELFQTIRNNCFSSWGSFPLSSAADDNSQSDNDHDADTPYDSTTNCNKNDDSEGNDQIKSNAENNRRRKAFMVAKEIATSEKSFVAILRLLNDDFKIFLYEKGCINFVQSTKGVERGTTGSDGIPEKDLDEILKYLPNLQSLNEEILVDFEARIAGWDSLDKIADIIVKKGPFLKLYATYIKELENHTLLLQECAEKYPSFGECLKEFENSEQCRFLPVSKHMLTPMQRITKYKELMKQYLKYLPEDGADYANAVQALNIVEDVAQHANEAIRELENSARLLSLQERLNGISNADSPFIGLSLGNPQHLLVEPGRRLLKEGQLMKLCRRGVRVVYLILLTDSLLYTTQEIHGGKNSPLKLRYKLPLEGMRLDIPVSEDFQSEFTVISTSRSFTVRASGTKERDAWLSSLRSAIESNASRRSSFEKAKTAEFKVLGSNVLGKQAPAWVPDNRVTMCQLCTSEFSLTFRRHHCRACGKVVCRDCSANRAPLAYLDNHTERVCDICFEELQTALCVLEEKEVEITDEAEKERFRRSLTLIKGRFSRRGIKDSRSRRLKKPERLLEVCGGDHTSQICGYLRLYSRRTWRHSWFVLKDKVLYEYRAPEDVCALSSLPILGYSVNTECKSLDIFDGMVPYNAFQLVHTNQSPLIFYAESTDLAEKWRTTMEKEVNL